MKKSWFPFLIVAAALIASAVTYSDMPSQLPVHWNINNEVDRYASKGFALFFLPVLMLLLILLFRIMPLFDAKKQNYGKFETSIQIIQNVLLLVFLVIHAMTIGFGYGLELNVATIVPLVVGILFVVLGNYMPRFQPNSYFGIKNGKTLGSDTVWRKTHQTAAKFYVIGGLLIILTAFVPAPFQIVAFLSIAVAVVLSSLFLSVYFSKRHT